MKIKYMGSSDSMTLNKGEDFDGQLADPLDRDIEWNWENRHVIDTADFDGVGDEFWTLLLEDKERFKDVSDLKVIPTNAAQQLWRGAKKSQDAQKAGVANESGTAETDTTSEAPQGVSEASDVGGGATTTTGGSTAGGSTGRGGRARGGST